MSTSGSILHVVLGSVWHKRNEGSREWRTQPFILDGWWAEAYDPALGWAVGDHRNSTDEAAQDATEADQLYSILENQVIPLYYRRERNGIPVSWVAMMRESMARLTGQYSANRSVREYTERYYLPAADAYDKRTGNNGDFAVQLHAKRTALRTHWPRFTFMNSRQAATNMEPSFRLTLSRGCLPGAYSGRTIRRQSR